MTIHSSIAPCALAARQKRADGQRIRLSRPGRPTTCGACLTLEAAHVLANDLDERQSWAFIDNAALKQAVADRAFQQTFRDALFPKLLFKGPAK